MTKQKSDNNSLEKLPKRMREYDHTSIKARKEGSEQKRKVKGQNRNNRKPPENDKNGHKKKCNDKT